jgi:hypothetical protein
MFQVQRDAQLVAQAVDGGNGDIVRGFAREFGPVRAEVRRVGAARISAGWILDLDYFGAEARQD